MVTWRAKVQGQKLCELFKKDLANPHVTTSDEIDNFWKLDKCFQKIPMSRF